jgi:hypothetical protein
MRSNLAMPYEFDTAWVLVLHFFIVLMSFSV